MRRMLRFPSAFLALVLVAGCAPSGQPISVPSPMASPAGAWTLTFTQSGGFAGVLLSLRVSSDGSYSAEDGRSGRRTAGTLPAESLGTLRQLVLDAALWSSPARPSACADCFIYDLVLKAANGTTTIHADDTSIGSTGAQAAISLLIKMRDDALAASR